MNRDLEYAFKSDSNGSWYWFDGIDRNELYFNGYESKNIPVDQLLKKLKEIAKNPDNRPHSIIYPRAFLDFSYPLTEKVNRNVIKTISSIYNRDKSLEDINPYEFEDIVAELLENIGFQIYKTPKSRDGGRDLIARGEMAPGFPINIAVEVKKKKKVPIKDIRDTLYANRNYPKIMVVTTGTFSAGVYKCQKSEENLYRLDLKDGIAVSQLIQGYIKER
jgi:HJR/Mrr/RecB family endonuclease